VLRKTDPQRMNTVLHVSAEVLRQIGILIQPHMPASARKLLDLLGIPTTERSFDSLGASRRIESGTSLPVPQPVFPRHVEPAEQIQPA